MRRLSTFTRTLALSGALTLAMLPVAALAGQNDRALAAIAEARGKIEAGDKVGAASEASEVQMHARSTLDEARALLSKGKKTEAIAAAQQAGRYADEAITTADQHKTATAAADKARGDQATATAQQTAAIATARADTAMQMARPAAPAEPMAMTTTVTTEDREIMKPAPVAPKTTTHKRTTHTTTHKAAPRPTTAVKTTTTVTTAPK